MQQEASLEKSCELILVSLKTTPVVRIGMDHSESRESSGSGENDA